MAKINLSVSVDAGVVAKLLSLYQRKDINRRVEKYFMGLIRKAEKIGK